MVSTWRFDRHSLGSNPGSPAKGVFIIDRFKPKTIFAPFNFNEAMYQMSTSAEEATAAFEKFVQEINKKILSKEYKTMSNKVFLMTARLHTLEGRNTECERIRAKLRRQIRKLHAAMAA